MPVLWAAGIAELSWRILHKGLESKVFEYSTFPQYDANGEDFKWCKMGETLQVTLYLTELKEGAYI